MALNIKVSGTWREAVPKVKVSGTWRDVSQAYVKVSGEWKALLSSLNFIIYYSAGATGVIKSSDGSADHIYDIRSNQSFSLFDSESKLLTIEVNEGSSYGTTYTGIFNTSDGSLIESNNFFSDAKIPHEAVIVNDLIFVAGEIIPTQNATTNNSYNFLDIQGDSRNYYAASHLGPNKVVMFGTYFSDYATRIVDNLTGNSLSDTTFTGSSTAFGFTYGGMVGSQVSEHAYVFLNFQFDDNAIYHIDSTNNPVALYTTTNSIFSMSKRSFVDDSGNLYWCNGSTNVKKLTPTGTNTIDFTFSKNVQTAKLVENDHSKVIIMFTDRSMKIFNLSDWSEITEIDSEFFNPYPSTSADTSYVRAVEII